MPRTCPRGAYVYSPDKGKVYCVLGLILNSETAMKAGEVASPSTAEGNGTP